DIENHLHVIRALAAENTMLDRASVELLAELARQVVENSRTELLADEGGNLPRETRGDFALGVVIRHDIRGPTIAGYGDSFQSVAGVAVELGVLRAPCQQQAGGKQASEPYQFHAAPGSTHSASYKRMKLKEILTDGLCPVFTGVRVGEWYGA